MPSSLHHWVLLNILDYQTEISCSLINFSLLYSNVVVLAGLVSILSAITYHTVENNENLNAINAILEVQQLHCRSSISLPKNYLT